MQLDETIRKVTRTLHSGNLANEAQVKQAVIVPILRALDWDDSDPNSFKPEFQVQNGFVDYALLGHGKPLVFIEAKKLGKVDEKGEEQLFRYASNRGVPFLILTDGNQWDFYLSMAPGEPTERRFFRLLLKQSQNISEYRDFFESHLRKTEVVSNQAYRSAQDRHTGIMERQKAKATISGAWDYLLSGPDEILLDLLIEQVESECGTKPHPEDAIDFIKQIATHAPQQVEVTARSKFGGYVLDGKSVEASNSIRTLHALLREFSNLNPQFLNSFAIATASQKRRLVATDKTKLYERQDLISKSLSLENGWWLGTNYGKEQIRNFIQVACREANIEYGTRLKIIEQ